jgi:AcrR family transcriptional regulator
MRRFTSDGYATTTVRQIADDAGVNGALISRYFSSKEGLFEACLAEAVGSLRRSAGAVGALPDVAEAMSRHAAGVAAHGGPPDALLLLLRSSGDPAAERLRVGVLRSFGERLAAAAARERPADGRGPDDADLVLRAQVVLATGVGIAVLRATGGLEPLASAGHEDLVAPMRDLIAAVLR